LFRSRNIEISHQDDRKALELLKTNVFKESLKKWKIGVDLRGRVDKYDRAILESCCDDAAGEIHRKPLMKPKDDRAGPSIAEDSGAGVRRVGSARMEVRLSILTNILQKRWTAANVRKASLYFTESNEVERNSEEAAAVRRTNEAT
jgi:hypothetical protein